MLGSIRSIWGIHSSRTCGGENDAIFADEINTWNIIVLNQREGCDFHRYCRCQEMPTRLCCCSYLQRGYSMGNVYVWIGISCQISWESSRTPDVGEWARPHKTALTLAPGVFYFDISIFPNTLIKDYIFICISYLRTLNISYYNGILERQGY